MTTLALLTALWMTPTDAPSIDGMATYYAPGLMQAVADNRGMDLSHYRGGVALNRAADLGRTVWLEHDGKIDGPFLVVDCARQGVHFNDRESRGHVLEVDYRQARDWRMVGAGPIPVRVWFELPPAAATLQPR